MFAATVVHMTALLAIPEIRARALRLSLADYHRLGKGLRAGLLRGIVIKKIPQSRLRAPVESGFVRRQLDLTGLFA